HLGAVALAGLEPGDAKVATRPVRHAWGDIIKDFLSDAGVVKEAQRLPARVEVASAAEGDDLLGHWANLFCLGLGRRDALIAQQVGDEVAVERNAMAGFAAKVAAGQAVSHD